MGDYFRNLNPGLNTPFRYSEGDEYISPVFPEGGYNYLRNLRVHFVGHFEVVTITYLEEETKRRGGKPRKSINANSHYDAIVVGDSPPQRPLNIARDNDIEVLTFREFYQRVINDVRTEDLERNG